MPPNETSPALTAPTDEPPRRHSRWWWFGMIVFVLAMLVLGAFAALRIGLSGGVSDRLAEVAAAGYPTTPAELEKWHVYPKGVNAAEEYAKAFSLLSEPKESAKADLPLCGDAKFPADPAEPLTEAMATAIGAHLEANRGALEGLHAAAKIEIARWPVDWTRGFSVELRHVQEVRDGSRLLALEAAQRAEAGEAESAVQSILSALALGRSLETEPALISQLVRMVVVNASVDATERLVNRTAVPADLLGRLEAALDAAEAPESLKRAMVGERAMGSSLFTGEGLAAATSTGATQQGMGLYGLAGLLDYDHLQYLDLMQRYVEGAGKPLARRRAAFRDAEDGIKDVGVFGGMVTRMVAPGVAQMAVQEAKAIARLRAARVALAAERYHLGQERLPGKIEDIVPGFIKAIPADPFDGKPIRYKTTPKGAVAFSAGENETDDGGTGDDITFRISQRPAANN